LNGCFYQKNGEENKKIGMVSPNILQLWVYISLNIVFLIITVFALRNKVDLIRECVKPGEGIKWWDRVFIVFSTIVFSFCIVLACLDTGRFG
jgi:ABC-type multidrug transport system permease subunit